MILDNCGAGRCLGARSSRSVDRVDETVGALKEGLCWTWSDRYPDSFEWGRPPVYSRPNSIG